MTLREVQFDETTIGNLVQKPLIRDNVEHLMADFNLVYMEVMKAEVPEEALESAVKLKSDLFAAFCHGAQIATRVDSCFRQNYKLPKEFDPTDQIISESRKKIITP